MGLLRYALIASFAGSFAMTGVAAAASTNLVQNGSFEGADGLSDWSIGGTAGDGYVPVAIGYNQSSEYPTGAQGEAVPTDDAMSASPDGPGLQGAYFVSDQATDLSLYQYVYLTPGSYDIGFDTYDTYNGFDQPGDATLTAEIAGVQLASYQLSSVQPGIWSTHSGEADILTAGDYLVTFTFNTPGSPENAKDVVIDQAYVLASPTGGGVPISAAPEASVWALMVAGVGLIGAALRLGRRREARVAASA